MRPAATRTSQPIFSTSTRRCPTDCVEGLEIGDWGLGGVKENLFLSDRRCPAGLVCESNIGICRVGDLLYFVRGLGFRVYRVWRVGDLLYLIRA